MKIKFSSDYNCGLEIIAEDRAEEKELEKLFEMGHLHFCCKYLYVPPKKNKKKTLLLTPSAIEWKRKIS